MGHINLSKIQLVTELSEVVGFKSGLIFSYKDLLKLSGDIYSKYIDGNIYSFIRIEASEYEEFYYEVLKNCGYMPKDIDPNELRFYTIHLIKKYGLGTKEFNIGFDIYKDYIDFLSNFLITNSQETKVINPTSFIELCKLKHGDFGVLIAIELLQMQNLSYHFSPYTDIRRVEWENQIELKDLFESEKLDSLYGSFIDQRYIDYLSNNKDDICKINWRKFEALTCEWFDRNGYYVEIGKGRKDGGIDVKVWNKKKDANNPPLILIQCKRYNANVGDVIVKALWADVVAEKANSGIIVTSSKVTSGAKRLRDARGYNIDFAENSNIKEWLQNMRTTDKEYIV